MKYFVPFFTEVLETYLFGKMNVVRDSWCLSFVTRYEISWIWDKATNLDIGLQIGYNKYKEEFLDMMSLNEGTRGATFQISFNTNRWPPMN